MDRSCGCGLLVDQAVEEGWLKFGLSCDFCRRRRRSFVLQGISITLLISVVDARLELKDEGAGRQRLRRSRCDYHTLRQL